MSSKKLSQQVSFEPICAILIIFAILSVPKYLPLPDSLVLLYHDMFGQILLLLFAVLVGSYSFLCGVLLVILFISIMIQTKYYVSEGFVGSQDSDMVLGKGKTEEEFEDQVTPQSATGNVVNQTTPMITQSPTTPMVRQSPTTPMNTSRPQIAGASTPAPTSMASEAKFPSDVEGYKTTIKKLEEELNECKATNLTLKTNMTAPSVPLPTMGSNMASRPSNPESFEDVEDEEHKLESKARKITVMSTDEGSEEFEGEMDGNEGEDIEEGFCGCDRSDNRVKLAKVLAQSEPSFNENFKNPPQMKTASLNPYDIAGCRYDNDFEKELHDTFYGPPLASCRAYNGSTKSIGTLFYPMN
jgi:hypothetical protein